MARPTRLLAALRDLVRREVADAMQTMLNIVSPTKKPRKKRTAKNGRRTRRGRAARRRSERLSNDHCEPPHRALTR